MPFRVLVVDDYPGAADMTCALVRLLGCDAKPAGNATEALKIFESFAPQVVVLDLGLPDASGYEVAREIRRRGGGKQLFIAAMTGWAEPSHVHSLAADIDMHIVKPASEENLGRILDAAKALLGESTRV